MLTRETNKKKTISEVMKEAFTNSTTRINWVPALAIVVLAAVAQSCYIQAKEKGQEKAQPVVHGTPVDGIVIKAEPLKEELEVTGSIVANQHVEIASELTRKVVRVGVKEGSLVRKGTVLFELDNADLLAQLERLRQQEKLATLNEQRLKGLIEKDAIVQQDYDEALTNLKVLQAQIEELLVTINKTRIVAPFDGKIGMINTHPGAIVSTNTVLTAIEDNSILKLEFFVPEKYAHKIPEGSTHEFQIASENEMHTATVYAKAPGLTTGTRNLTMRAWVKNVDRKLLPGQSARIKLKVAEASDAILIPSHALIPSPEGYSVLVVTRGKAALKQVKVGVRKVNTVEIKSGLNVGDTLATSNLLRIGTGSPVELASLK